MTKSITLSGKVIPVAMLVSLCVMTSISARADQPGVQKPARAESLPSASVAKMHFVNQDAVIWTSGLMKQRFDVCAEVMIPVMGKLMDGKEPSQFLENFRVAAALVEGKHRGPKWNDGDFYKWLESAAATFAVQKNAALDQQMDQAIEIIGKAQRADGYLHTATIIKQKSGDASARELLEPLDFELYNMGHLMSAACMHYRATGKTSLLRIAEKSADYLCGKFETPDADKARFGICPAHLSGLVELYRVTGKRSYLELAGKMIDMRDKVQSGTDDNQDRIPFRQQTKAIGHAVRANYLYAGAADLFLETGDKSLLDPLEKIWTDLVAHKMYITGGCGALYDGASPDGVKEQKTITRVHQAYGRDFQLPNATAHNETCAAIGSVLWSARMLQITADAKYADLMEQTLYNSVLTGVGLDGKTFFYTNPLRVTDPMPVALRWSRQRQPFISVFCCPPNVLRTLAESAHFAYGISPSADKNGVTDLFVNLYGASQMNLTLADGSNARLVQTTEYPWDGRIKIQIASESKNEIAVNVRIPGWANESSVRLNGEVIGKNIRPSSYFRISRRWTPADKIELDLPMSAKIIEANPLVEELRNQLAVTRGPIVYCLESPDLPENVKLSDCRLSPKLPLKSQWDGNMLGGISVVQAELSVSESGKWSGLYREVNQQKSENQKVVVKLIPYFCWANRGKSEMTVWIPSGE